MEQCRRRQRPSISEQESDREVCRIQQTFGTDIRRL